MAKDIGDRLAQYGHEDVVDCCPKRVVEDGDMQLNTRRGEDVRGHRHLFLQRGSLVARRNLPDVGPGGGTDPPHQLDLSARLGIVAGDQLFDQIGLERERRES